MTIKKKPEVSPLLKALRALSKMQEWRKNVKRTNPKNNGKV